MGVLFDREIGLGLQYKVKNSRGLGSRVEVRRLKHRLGAFFRSDLCQCMQVFELHRTPGKGIIERQFVFSYKENI